ncbi:MAG TPA: PhnD/SsuA/transferrin family substrate-binding protein [Burkholderiales bacterium]|nr:PhnD/SsuA/transferrin family substrate-binding protein [Burkholderiales bacterium]
MKKLAAVAASLVLGLLAAGPARAELVLAVNEGVTYYVTPSEIREKYKELADLIGRNLHMTVKVVPVDQYPVLRKGLDEQQYDLAFVHPAHHSLMSIRDGKYRLVVLTKGYTEYKARFFVMKNAHFSQPGDMKGKRFGMPDPDSITAVITRATLRDLGIDARTADIRTTRYQDAVPFFVENGFSDVGVTGSGAVVKQWQEKGGAVLLESKGVPIKHMIASTKMSDADVEKVRAIMLGLDKSESGQKILAKLGYKGYEIGDPQQLATLTKWLGY